MMVLGTQHPGRPAETLLSPTRRVGQLSRPAWATLTRILVGAAAAVCAVPDGSSATESTPMTTTQPEHTNRLIHATSPYLLQHASNPVDWYEWGAEAFAKAKKNDKPIFLSIGYSACHWCHVMEHETFEDTGVAAVLNEHFVSIKVDREERPDVDEIYMQATMAMNNGNGGWPMSVFLTPDRVPFFAGTYFPREHFLQLLHNINEAWDTRRQDILEQSGNVQAYLRDWAKGLPADGTEVPHELVIRTARALAMHFDPKHGGLASGSNKFPPSMSMELMLRAHLHTGDDTLLRCVENTLDHMAYGGIYDQLGGGICRYSTDPEWLVPHFEKMLYDQALVSSIYLDAYQLTGKPLYARIAAEILDYVIDDLQSPEGGFYSTRDADSEGLEGKYYIWTIEQVREALGAEDAKLFCDYYDVTDSGNWNELHGHAPPGPKNILRVQKPPAEFAALHGLEVERLEARLASMRSTLLEARRKRVPPGLDDKVLTAWNGLMIASLAKGANILGEPKYAQAAARAADFVLLHLRRDGRLLRTWRRGEARLRGYLSDYAFLIEGLIHLYETTFNDRWLKEADGLNQILIRFYYDEAKGGFFFTASDAEPLIARTKNPRDGAIPSGNSVQALNLLRLAALLGQEDYRAKAEAIFGAFRQMTESNPSAFERLLCGLDFARTLTQEIAVVGSPTDADTRALLAVVHARYRPNKILAVSDGSDGSDPAASVPLLRGKTARDGRPTAYVCRNYVCKAPVATPEELASQLDGK
jgi:uncharacterized protein YyaL (SSP411 family)